MSRSYHDIEDIRKLKCDQAYLRFEMKKNELSSKLGKKWEDSSEYSKLAASVRKEVDGIDAEAKVLRQNIEDKTRKQTERITFVIGAVLVGLYLLSLTY